MQQTPADSNPLSTTCFDLECYERFARNESLTPDQPVSPSAFLRKPVPVTSPLSLAAPRQRLDNWRLVHAQSKQDTLKPRHIIGALVCTARGYTSQISAFDPATRRVRTRSGSIYQLGTPEMSFERVAPEVVRSLGF